MGIPGDHPQHGAHRATNPGGILEHSLGERDSLFQKGHATGPFPPGVLDAPCWGWSKES